MLKKLQEKLNILSKYRESIKKYQNLTSRDEKYTIEMRNTLSGANGRLEELSEENISWIEDIAIETIQN